MNTHALIFSPSERHGRGMVSLPCRESCRWILSYFFVKETCEIDVLDVWFAFLLVIWTTGNSLKKASMLDTTENMRPDPWAFSEQFCHLHPPDCVGDSVLNSLQVKLLF